MMSDILVCVPVWMVEDAIRSLRKFEDETVEAMKASPGDKRYAFWDRDYEDAFHVRRQLESELRYIGVETDESE